MRLSLIVSTYNWPDALRVVLASALRQESLPDEIIVADDGSTGATREVVTECAARATIPVIHAWHEDRGFRLAAVRNLALRQATGDYVVVIDGDIVLHPRFVAAHRALAQPGSYAQGSRVMLGPATTARVLREGPASLGFFIPDGRNLLSGLPWPWLSRFVRTDQDPLRRTRGCHLGFWMADVVRVNGFNEDFVGWGREDSEFVCRLMNAGVRRRNTKFGPVCWHLDHPVNARAAITERNHAIFEEARRSRRIRCDRGLVVDAT